MRKIKLLAPFLMLLSGLIASIMMFYYHYEKTAPADSRIGNASVLCCGGFYQKKVNQFIQKYEEEERRKAQGEVI